MKESNTVRQWLTVFSERLGSFRIFDLYKVRRREEQEAVVGDFFVLDCADWVNIIPITTDGRIVFVRQYRHGVDHVTLELPGGMIDPGESPDHAAMRECIEETGYASPSPAEYLGYCHPNPAFLTNRCHTFLWTGCSESNAKSTDTHEFTETVLLDWSQTQEALQSGQISHALVVAAFQHYHLRTGAGATHRN